MKRIKPVVREILFVTTFRERFKTVIRRAMIAWENSFLYFDLRGRGLDCA